MTDSTHPNVGDDDGIGTTPAPVPEVDASDFADVAEAHIPAVATYEPEGD